MKTLRLCIPLVLATACFYKFDNPVDQQPPGSISGQLVLQGAAPGQTLAGATVGLRVTSSSITTDTTGSFLFTGLPTGSYNLAFQVPPANVNDLPLLAFRAGLQLPETAGEVDSLALGKIPLEPAGVVSGAIIGATGPVQVAAFVPDSGVYENYDVAAVDGGYRIVLPAGTHLLIASDTANEGSLQVAAVSSQTLTGQNIQLTSSPGPAVVVGTLVFGSQGVQASASSVSGLLGLTNFAAVNELGQVADAGVQFQQQVPGVGVPFSATLPAGHVYTLTFTFSNASTAGGPYYPPFVISNVPALAGQTVQLGTVTWLASSGAADAGVDAGPAGMDAGADAGPDAGLDSGADAGADAGPDAGEGLDAGPDAGADAGADAGPDAGVVDAGPDAGPQVTVVVLAGNSRAGSVVTDGLGIDAGFARLAFGAFDPVTRRLFVSDTVDLRSFDGHGSVSTLAGNSVNGNYDGTGSLGGTTEFSELYGVAYDSLLGVVFTADPYNNAIRATNLQTGLTTTVVGNPEGLPGYSDGYFGDAGIDFPTALADDGAGHLYVVAVGTSLYQSVVRRLDFASGTITTLKTAIDGGFALFSEVAVSPSGMLVLSGELRAGAIALVDLNPVADTFGAPVNPSIALSSAQVGLSFDPSGALYVADPSSARVLVFRDGGEAILAGPGAPGAVGDAGVFEYPTAAIPDGLGNVYVLDSAQLKVIIPAGGTGLPNLGPPPFDAGPAPGLLASATATIVANSTGFGTPTAIAVDGLGNVFLGDSSARTIWLVNDAGITSLGLLAPGEIVDPVALVADGLGNVYYADHSLNAVYFINLAVGATSLIAGGGGQGFEDGFGSSTKLNQPSGLAIDGTGNLWIADYANCAIRSYNPSTQQLTTVVGGGLPPLANVETYNGDGELIVPAGHDGNPQGFPNLAALQGPSNLAFDSSGDLFFADAYPATTTVNASTVRVVNTVGQVSTLAAYLRDTGGQQVVGLAVDSQGQVYVSSNANNSAQLDSFSGPFEQDSRATASMGFSGGGVALGGGGLYVADPTQNRLLELTESGPALAPAQPAQGFLNGVPQRDAGGLGLASSSTSVSTVAGVCQPSLTDGVGFFAGFVALGGLAFDQSNDLFMIDDKRVREMSAGDGGEAISSVVDTGDSPGYLDGDAGVALLSSGGFLPSAMCGDGRGNFFIADTGNNVIREYATANQLVTTYAGQAGAGGYVDGPVATALFSAPSLIACDQVTGLVYVFDLFNSALRVTDGKTVSTVIAADAGIITSASVFSPTALAVVAPGNLVFSEGAGLWSYLGDGGATVLVGTGEGDGADGPAGLASLGSAYGLWYDAPDDTLFIADNTYHRIRTLSPVSASGLVSTFAGNGYSLALDGTGGVGSASFVGPTSLLGLGNFSNGISLYVSDGNRLRLVSVGGN